MDNFSETVAPSGRPLQPRQIADTVYQIGLVGAILLLLWTTF